MHACRRKHESIYILYYKLVIKETLLTIMKKRFQKKNKRFIFVGKNNFDVCVCVCITIYVYRGACMSYVTNSDYQIMLAASASQNQHRNRSYMSPIN